MQKVKNFLLISILFFIFLTPLQAKNRVGDKVKIYLKNNAVIIGKIKRITATTLYIRNKYALFPVKIRQIKRQLTLKKAPSKKPINTSKKNKSEDVKKARPNFLLALSGGYPLILNDFSKTLTPEPSLFLTLGIKLAPLTLSTELGVENYSGKDNAENKLMIFSFSARAKLFFLKSSKFKIGMITGIGASYIKAVLADEDIEAAGARFNFQIGPVFQYNLSKKMYLFLNLPFVFYVESSSSLAILQIKSGIGYEF